MKEAHKEEINTESTLVHKILRDQLFFRPIPPGIKQENIQALNFKKQVVEVDADPEEFSRLLTGLQSGAFTRAEINHITEKHKLPAPISKITRHGRDGLKLEGIESRC